MNKIKINLIYYAFSLLIIIGCTKNDDDNYVKHDSYLTNFESLTSENDTLLRGQSTTITAKVVGNNISFSWSASVGPLLGNGDQVIFIASPCCYGDIHITCEAKGKNESATKTLIITVLE